MWQEMNYAAEADGSFTAKSTARSWKTRKHFVADFGQLTPTKSQKVGKFRARINFTPETRAASVDEL